MPKGYHHLTYGQRCQIYTLKGIEKSLTEIASITGVGFDDYGSNWETAASLFQLIQCQWIKFF